MGGQVDAITQQIEQSLVAGEAFDPARSRQRFSIAVTDYVELICMTRLLERLAVLAPGVQIAISHLSPSLPAEALDKGELDLVLGRFQGIPPRFASRRWMSETLRLTARCDHPLLQGQPDLEGFLRLRHLWVHGGQTKGMVDLWLAERGLSRQILYTTPNYLQAAPSSPAATCGRAAHATGPLLRPPAAAGAARAALRRGALPP